MFTEWLDHNSQAHIAHHETTLSDMSTRDAAKCFCFRTAEQHEQVAQSTISLSE